MKRSLQLNTVLAYVRAMSFPIRQITDFDHMGDVDAAIDLGDGRHIQIGRDYIMVYDTPSSDDAVLGALIAEIDSINLTQLHHALTTTH